MIKEIVVRIICYALGIGASLLLFSIINWNMDADSWAEPFRISFCFVAGVFGQMLFQLYLKNPSK